ncbi:unnamed protein product [Rotaria sp. Silwood1]|nr:unnamed protein product [Rotaria sp. Silwood1]CAF1647233.1 unnamed protein product [Rotaria sp. Silwood1]CAF3830177.1 unnamed protein product [Rotaria sp. Silwood1]CAF3833703.1 unnamed protein product [Rotaria sp. Silwood1]CAF3838943.1 unnamed protein product [Rotaria sp. Silwood1]
MIKLTEDKLKEHSKRKGPKASATTNINFVPVTTNTAPETNEVIPSPTPLSQVLLNDHKQYVLNLLKQWYSHNKEKLKLDNVDFTEGVDFHLNLININDDIDATILCNCGALTKLPKKDGKLQLSNFYKHLKDSKCLHMKEKKKKNKEIAQLPIEQTSTPKAITSSITLTPQISSNTPSSQPTTLSAKRSAIASDMLSSVKKRPKYML